MSNCLEDTELGIVRLVANSKARRIIVRFKDGCFYLTHPKGLKEQDIRSSIDKLRPKLLLLKERADSASVFTEETIFFTLAFTVYIKRGPLNNTYVSLKDGELNVIFSSKTDINTPEAQKYIKEVIESYCRIEAKKIFPEWVLALASKYGFTVNRVKINNSRGRWGSCSSKKDINLSYFCMMLPRHLAEFVILHELCHTKEMNHGEGFWKLLDSVTNNRARELTLELKNIRLKW